MTLLSYQVFKTLAEMGSFRKAADILGLTPSAISHTISAMEKELGFYQDASLNIRIVLPQ